MFESQYATFVLLGLSGGAIAGIVIVLVLLVAVAVIVIICIIWWKKSSSEFVKEITISSLTDSTSFFFILQI